MVFPSVPIYLDHHTWLQQQNLHHAGDSVIENFQLSATTVPQIIGGTVVTRPCSMSEHARLAKLQYPEAPLKCPRCESTNTKFCYFNNYSLSQPRHFCKTCRRYWTRGGALRDVPVGGGCRRSSKKSKGNQSKSPITTPISPKFIANPNLPIFSSMPNACEFPNAAGNNDLGFQIGKVSGNTGGTLDLAGAFGDQWMTSSTHEMNSNQAVVSGFAGRFEQLPGGGYNLNQVAYDEAGFAQMLKQQEENQGLSMSSSRSFQRFTGNEQYWSNGNTWTDISGSASSSASHFM